MTDWKEYRFGDVVDIIMGQSPKGSTCNISKSGIPLLNGPTEFGDRFPTAVQYTTDPKRISQKGDILFCVRGSTTGRMNYSDKKYAIGRGLAAIRHKQGKELQSFVKGLIDIILPSMLQHVTGSTFPNLSKDQLNDYKVEIPADLPTQTRIASILSSLDDKIELNRRMNHTLEQIAQTLFNHYFVDNIDRDNLPEGWRKGEVGEVLELKYGKALKEDQRRIGKYAVVGSGGIIGYHDEFICNAKGIVVGRKGNSGAVSWLHEAFYPIDTTFYVSDLSGVEELYFFYFLLKSLNLKNLNSDSAVPGLNRNEAHHQEIVIPDYTTIIMFNNSVSCFFNKVDINLKEIKSLSTIRDTLLPKLMSGQIDVSQLNEEKIKENYATEDILNA